MGEHGACAVKTVAEAAAFPVTGNCLPAKPERGDFNVQCSGPSLHPSYLLTGNSYGAPTDAVAAGPA